MLVDSHCHLDQLDLTSFQGSLDTVINRAKEVGVDHLLCVCITLEQFPAMLQVASRYEQVSASVGLHPNEYPVESEPSAADIIALAQHPKIVAIGETGLDYFRSQGDTEWQRQRFREHIQAAKKIKKPLIIHTRQAKEDTLKIMQEEGAAEVGGVMHCFTEDWDTAQKALDLNFYISFSGIVTFKNAHVIHEVAKKVPLDYMLIETDSPYLAPEPYRGKPNEPAYVKYVAEYLANLRGIDLVELGAITSENFYRLFKVNRT